MIVTFALSALFLAVLDVHTAAIFASGGFFALGLRWIMCVGRLPSGAPDGGQAAGQPAPRSRPAATPSSSSDVAAGPVERVPLRSVRSGDLAGRSPDGKGASTSAP